MKVYDVPPAKPDIVAVVPVPVVVPPFQFKVQVPVEGKPLNTTEPVGTAQEGCKLIAAVGGVGFVVFCVIAIAAVLEQPFAPVTVTVYVAGLLTLRFAELPTTLLPSLHE